MTEPAQEKGGIQTLTNGEKEWVKQSYEQHKMVRNQNFMPAKGLCDIQGTSPEKTENSIHSPSRSSAYEGQHPNEEIGANN